jgi:hypothetical protein
MDTSIATPRGQAGRFSYAGLTVLLLAALVFEVARHGTGYWQLGAFGLGPDLALFVGASRGLRRGQLHPRAVPLYNALHRFWGPLALACLASLGVVPLGFFIGALAWGLHVSLDRAVGYGLRTRDGFQRT